MTIKDSGQSKPRQGMNRNAVIVLGILIGIFLLAILLRQVFLPEIYPLGEPTGAKLVLAGETSFLIVDVDTGAINAVEVPGIDPATLGVTTQSISPSLMRRGSHLVGVAKGRAFSIEASLQEPFVDLGPANAILPSPTNDRVWLLAFDRQTRASVREVDVKGKELTPSHTLPALHLPFAALNDGLWTQVDAGGAPASSKFIIWDPLSQMIVREFAEPNQLLIAAFGDLVAILEPCCKARILDLSIDKEVSVEMPPGARGFRPPGLMDPTGRKLALVADFDDTSGDLISRVAVFSTRTGESISVIDPGLDATRLEWSPSGDLLFFSGGRSGSEAAGVYVYGLVSDQIHPIPLGVTFRDFVAF